MSDKKKGPLKESVDYPDFVRNFVKEKLAQKDQECTEELATYIAQDLEDYLLDAGKTVAELTDAEMMHVDVYINQRIDEAKDILPTKGARS